jgi:[calcium/calmodulin-dependent protein kinase] kinase
MGIIHRDIKPANMLWTKGRARVKLTDFGVAHFSKPLTADKATSSDGSPYVDDEDHLYKTEGTPAFYAPEQAYNQNGLPVPKFERGKRPPGVKSDQIFPMTKALDVWAFGVSIYCFLFGRPPYWALNVHALCHAIIEDEYVIPPLATSDQIPIDSNDPDLNEALNLMKGMMTKPVHARLTLSQAKVRQHPGFPRLIFT